MNRYLLQSWRLWLAFGLSVVPIVLLLFAGLLMALELTAFIKPNMIHWDGFDVDSGKPVGGSGIIGWRVGSIDISNTAMYTARVCVRLFIAAIWYSFILFLGRRNQRKLENVAPTIAPSATNGPAAGGAI